MGVDFYPCSECGETFCDVGPYASCDDCGEMLCESCMNKYDIGGRMANIAAHEEDYEDDEDDEYSQCPFCAKTAVSDDTLLSFALSKLSMTKDELTALYKTKEPTA